MQKPIEGKYKNLSAISAFNGTILDTGNNVIRNHRIPKEIIRERLNMKGIVTKTANIKATARENSWIGKELTILAG